jgi:carboxyl-terminal processing protease
MYLASGSRGKLRQARGFARMRPSVVCLMCIVGTPGVAGTQADPEALEKLAQDGVLFQPGSAQELAAAPTFKAYLLEKDPYADFLTPDEYAQFKTVQGEEYAGIGMELERDGTGSIRCYPDQGGAAARAGVAAGDELIAMDGHPVHGSALPTLAALAAGAAGSSLVIDIARQDRQVKRLAIVRRHLNGPSVVEKGYGTRTVVRIASFTPNTRQELEFVLANRRSNDPLILDLRGNRGGDLNAAIDCAMLFVNAGDTVVSVRGKHGVQPYLSSTPRRPQPQPVFLWQDAGTASAAELFIAALTENRCGISIGKKSFGKGTKQDLTVLRSGSVLIFTTGYLLTPSGKEIDGHGLAPDRAVAGSGTGATEYLHEVNLISRRPD